MDPKRGCLPKALIEAMHSKQGVFKVKLSGPVVAWIEYLGAKGLVGQDLKAQWWDIGCLEECWVHEGDHKTSHLVHGR